MKGEGKREKRMRLRYIFILIYDASLLLEQHAVMVDFIIIISAMLRHKTLPSQKVNGAIIRATKGKGLTRDRG